MSETGTASAQTAPTPGAAPPQTELIAGKWKDDAAAQEGMRQLFKHRNVPVADNAPVYGEGGMFASRDAAVTFYKAMAGNATPEQPKERKKTNIEGMFKATGLDPEKFGKHVYEKESLDDESFQKLAASIQIRGADGEMYELDKESFDDIFGGRAKAKKAIDEASKIIQENNRQAAFKIAGGSKEHFDRLMQWKASNLDQAESAKFDAVIQGNDVSAAMDAIRLIKARYDEKNGGGSPVIGTMPSQSLAPPKDLGELKELNRRAMAGDIAAQRTLKANMAEITRRFS